MSYFFHTVIYQPIYNLLIFLYDVFPWKDFGIAIILATVLVKFVLLSFSRKQIESQKRMQELQPKIKETQEKYKNDKERQAKEMMNLYKEHKVNPFSGCLPLIVQMVIFIAIYRVIINISHGGFVANLSDLYPFMRDPGAIRHVFLGLVDLAKPNYVLAVLSAGAQYYQMKMMMAAQAKNRTVVPKKEGEPDFATMMNKQMTVLAPAMAFFVGATFPAALALYWITSTVFMILQQRVILKTQAE